MKKHKRILLAALLVVVLGGLVLLAMPSGPPDPVYDGHPVSWWVRHPTNFTIGEVYERRLPQMDSNAVPYLIAALETQDGALRRAYIRAWPSMPQWLQMYLPKPVPAVAERQNAASALKHIGSGAAPAIPALVRALREDEDTIVRVEAIFALGNIGEDDQRAKERVTKALVETLNDTNPTVRAIAGKALKRLDPSTAAKAGVK